MAGCQQCTLTGFHFDPSTDQLTEAGRLKIQSILFEHPEQFRKIYVVRGYREEQSEKRVASVRETLTRVVEDGSNSRRAINRDRAPRCLGRRSPGDF